MGYSGRVSQTPTGTATWAAAATATATAVADAGQAKICRMAPSTAAPSALVGPPRLLLLRIHDEAVRVCACTSVSKAPSSNGTEGRAIGSLRAPVGVHVQSVQSSRMCREPCSLCVRVQTSHGAIQTHTITVREMWTSSYAVQL